MFVAFLLSRNARYQEALADQLFNSSENALPACFCNSPNLAKTASLNPWCPK